MMKTATEMLEAIGRGEYDTVFSRLYPEMPLKTCQQRYQTLLSTFRDQFGDRPVALVSAPGRTEVGGNHTDHQRGNALAAAVSLDTICVASPNTDYTIRVQSAGYPLDTVSLKELAIQEKETGTSAALIRGMAAWFDDKGIAPVGFDACTTSDVLAGSGLSSSAAFEVCMGTVMNLLWRGGKTAVEIAVAGQYAENHYFGKPCGLLDQLASAVGGFVLINFADTQNPQVRPVECDLAAYGYRLCIVNTRGDHSNLTDEYASIPAEMGRVAEYFGKQQLCEVEEKVFFEQLSEIRRQAGDRAVLRAIHFFRDTVLAVDMADALAKGSVSRFLENVVRSGRSSFTCLQNIYSVKEPEHQGLSLALALSESLLEGHGAWRVHGGGFAGTIQAFVPHHLLEEYRQSMDAVFGEGACQALSLRPVGATEVKPVGKGVESNG